MKIIYAIDGFLLIRRVKYDYEEIPFSMNKYFIHECNILSMDLEYPWVPCNISGLSTMSRNDLLGRNNQIQSETMQEGFREVTCSVENIWAEKKPFQQRA